VLSLKRPSKDTPTSGQLPDIRVLYIGNYPLGVGGQGSGIISDFICGGKNVNKEQNTEKVLKKKGRKRKDHRKTEVNGVRYMQKRQNKCEKSGQGVNMACSGRGRFFFGGGGRGPIKGHLR
jgi:hypothetical protein